jgi:hypothetical protein
MTAVKQHGSDIRQLVACTRKSLHDVAHSVYIIHTESKAQVIDVAKVRSMAYTFKSDVDALLQQCDTATDSVSVGTELVHEAASRALQSVLSSLQDAAVRQLNSEQLHEVIEQLRLMLEQQPSTGGVINNTVQCKQLVASALHGVLAHEAFGLAASVSELSAPVQEMISAINTSTLQAAYVADTLLRGMLVPILQAIQCKHLQYPTATVSVIRELCDSLAAIPCDASAMVSSTADAVNNAVHVLTDVFAPWAQRLSESLGSVYNINFLTTAAHILAQQLLLMSINGYATKLLQDVASVTTQQGPDAGIIDTSGAEPSLRTDDILLADTLMTCNALRNAPIQQLQSTLHKQALQLGVSVDALQQQLSQPAVLATASLLSTVNMCVTVKAGVSGDSVIEQAVLTQSMQRCMQACKDCSTLLAKPLSLIDGDSYSVLQTALDTDTVNIDEKCALLWDEVQQSSQSTESSITGAIALLQSATNDAHSLVESVQTLLQQQEIHLKREMQQQIAYQQALYQQYLADLEQKHTEHTAQKDKYDADIARAKECITDLVHSFKTHVINKALCSERDEVSDRLAELENKLNRKPAANVQAVLQTLRSTFNQVFELTPAFLTSTVTRLEATKKASLQLNFDSTQRYHQGLRINLTDWRFTIPYEHAQAAASTQSGDLTVQLRFINDTLTFWNHKHDGTLIVNLAVLENIHAAGAVPNAEQLRLHRPLHDGVTIETAVRTDTVTTEWFLKQRWVPRVDDTTSTGQHDSVPWTAIASADTTLMNILQTLSKPADLVLPKEPETAEQLTARRRARLKQVLTAAKVNAVKTGTVTQAATVAAAALQQYSAELETALQNNSSVDVSIATESLQTLIRLVLQGFRECIKPVIEQLNGTASRCYVTYLEERTSLLAEDVVSHIMTRAMSASKSSLLSSIHDARTALVQVVCESTIKNMIALMTAQALQTSTLQVKHHTD